MRKISSLALAFAFLMPLAGCPSDDTGETDSVVGTTTMTPPGTGTTTDEPATGDTAEPATDDAATEDTTAGGGGAGFCGQTCATPEDCAAGGNAADWECNEGFCDYVGTPPACDDTTCPAAAGLACADVNGINICTVPCTDGGTECDALMQECTGEDDAGNSICQPAPQPPCGGVAEGEACEGGFGVCTDGECVCTTNEECTAEGYGCRPAE